MESVSKLKQLCRTDAGAGSSPCSLFSGKLSGKEVCSGPFKSASNAGRRTTTLKPRVTARRAQVCLHPLSLREILRFNAHVFQRSCTSEKQACHESGSHKRHTRASQQSRKKIQP